MIFRRGLHGLLLAILLGVPQPLPAQELRVAVATNFLGTLQTLVSRYEQETGTEVRLSAGASGALYAQIANGAPFDVFFSADEARPRRLVDESLAVADSRFTYAVGVPVLWSAEPGVVDETGKVLHDDGFRHLALADPRHAPYGAAAQQIMQEIDVWDRLNRERRLVRAQSIGQAYSQVASGAAELGFVALAQVQGADGEIPGSHWIPPAGMYEPIVQQAVVLVRADQAAAAHFLAWIRSDEASAVIRAAGYGLE